MGFSRKYLSAEGLMNVVRECLSQEKFRVINGSKYTWLDCIMSGLAVFGFKSSSLLQFERQKTTEPLIRRNLRNLYKVAQAPSDTCLRERLDQVSPRQLKQAI